MLNKKLIIENIGGNVKQGDTLKGTNEGKQNQFDNTHKKGNCFCCKRHIWLELQKNKDMFPVRWKLVLWQELVP